MSALHPINQNSHPIRLFERKRVSFGQFGHEREHGEVGIAVHEHVFDELLCGKAVDRVLVATRGLGKVGEDLLPIFAGGATPSASWVDHVGLHVENELVAG